VVLPIQYVFFWYEWYSILIPIEAFLLLPMAVALRGSTDQYLVRIAETQWALMNCVFFASHVPVPLVLCAIVVEFSGGNEL
jgi:phosphatidate cytidylyltransferase